MEEEKTRVIQEKTEVNGHKGFRARTRGAIFCKILHSFSDLFYNNCQNSRAPIGS